MRDAFIARLSELAGTDARIVLITGDLGFGVLNEFERKFPEQFLNVGVAEQNMTAVATGLALEGRIVFTYSIGNFPILRCLEQLRNDACYHEANVKVVSVGGGFSYGQLGMSHHATEDLSIARAIPGLTVCVPGTALEARNAVDAVVSTEGAAYLRLERAPGEVVDDPNVPFALGRARVLREGTDLTLIGSGGIISEIGKAADELERHGIRCRLLSMHTLKPFDVQSVVKAAGETGGILTVEENTILGGLGGAVAEVCLEQQNRPKRFRRLGIGDRFVSIVGDQGYLRKHVEIDAASIAAMAQEMLRS